MILVNGAAQDAVCAADRGLAYGDGVFRTLRVRRKVPLHWARQYAKLAHDCAALAIPVPDERALAAEVRTASESVDDCVVKIIVTRGAGRRGYAYAGDETPTRIVLAEPLVRRPAWDARSGVAVRLCALRLASQPALAGVKHLNRLESVLARAEWREPAIGEGLLRDADGNIVCGTMSNLFVCRDGGLATPPLERCGVAGVTRDRVIEAASRHHVACTVSPLLWEDVLEADEVFVVNSLVGVCPVRALDGERREPGTLSALVREWLDREDEAQLAV